MRNEADEQSAREDMARKREEDPASAGLVDERLGRPPDQAEIDLLPHA